MVKSLISVIIEGLLYAFAFNMYQIVMYGMARHHTDSFMGLFITCMIISCLTKLLGVALDKKFKL